MRIWIHKHAVVIFSSALLSVFLLIIIISFKAGYYAKEFSPY